MFHVVTTPYEISNIPIPDHPQQLTIGDCIRNVSAGYEHTNRNINLRIRKTLHDEPLMRLAEHDAIGVMHAIYDECMYKPTNEEGFAQTSLLTNYERARYKSDTQQLVTTMTILNLDANNVVAAASIPLTNPVDSMHRLVLRHYATTATPSKEESQGVIKSMTQRVRANSGDAAQLIVNFTFVQNALPVSKMITLLNEVSFDEFDEITNPAVLEQLGTKCPVRIDQTVGLDKVRAFKSKTEDTVIIIRALFDQVAGLRTLLLAPVLLPKLQVLVKDQVEEFFTDLLASDLASTRIRANKIDPFLRKMYQKAKSAEEIIGELVATTKEKHRKQLIHDLETTTSELARIFRLHSELLDRKRSYDIELISVDKTQSELELFIRTLVRSQSVVNFNIVTSDTYTMFIETPAVNYEPDLAKILFTKQCKQPLLRVSYACYKGDLDSSGKIKFTTEMYNQFMHAIFSAQKGYLRFHAGIKVSLSKEEPDRYRDFYGIVERVPNYNIQSLANPHIASYNCFGNTGIAYQRVMKLRQYSQLLPILTTAVSNLNFSDGIVMNEFKQKISDIWRTGTKIIQDAETDELLSIQEFMFKYVLESKPEQAEETPSGEPPF